MAKYWWESPSESRSPILDEEQCLNIILTGNCITPVSQPGKPLPQKEDVMTGDYSPDGEDYYCITVNYAPVQGAGFKITATYRRPVFTTRV